MKLRFMLTPVPKPRMTQRDKWAKRPAVIRYRSFCDKCREIGLQVKEQGDRVVFIMPMPKSWSNKKRLSMDGKPHQQKPDVDNLLKAVFDATMKEDCSVWDIRATKLWGELGEIQVITDK